MYKQLVEYEIRKYQGSDAKGNFRVLYSIDIKQRRSLPVGDHHQVERRKIDRCRRHALSIANSIKECRTTHLSLGRIYIWPTEKVLFNHQLRPDISLRTFGYVDRIEQGRYKNHSNRQKMKKTVSVNIKGINFLIEEDAYELLQDYLDRLATTLRNESGCSDIIEDVELRIAELCSTKLSESKTVIELSDINEILAALGDPSEYVDEESEYAEETKSSNSSTKGSEKRLFRDTENAIIGGVCQGIADFLKLDVVIVRAIFVVLFLFGGFGFPLYIILWIIVPKAKSTIDRLRMKGRPITVENVKDEVGNAAERFKDGTKNFAGKIRENDTYKKSMSRGARILSTIAGSILILWGLSWLIALLVFSLGGFDFIPAIDDGGLLSLSDFGALVLPHTSDVGTAWVGGLLLASSSITLLLLLGSILIFRIRNKWANLSLLGIFVTGIIGLVMCLYLGAKTGRDFFYEGEIEKQIATVDTDELVVLTEIDDIGKPRKFHIKKNGRFGTVKISETSITDYGIHFKFKQSNDTLFHVHQYKSAHGRTRKKGEDKAERITHSMAIFGDTLTLQASYSFPRADKLREQEVIVIIEIPKGGRVRLNDQIVHLGGSISDDDGGEVEKTIYYNEDGYMEGSGSYYHYY